jgi:hypothetical protein
MSTPCSISVAGNVQIHSCASGGFLSGTLGLVDIGGNFQCYDNGEPCLAQFAKVGGNLQFYGNSGGGSIVRVVTVGGNLEFNDNTGATSPHFFNRLAANSVGGNVQVNGNSSSEDISDNTIGGNLSCTDNTGLTGSGNTVHGKEQGQCVGF